jgi:hypothetical protein
LVMLPPSEMLSMSLRSLWSFSTSNFSRPFTGLCTFLLGSYARDTRIGIIS